MARKKVKRIGFDLDGVIIGKPPIVPRAVIEWLYRSHENKKLAYRIPNKFEQKIRWLSHHPLLRPPLKENIDLVSKISKEGDTKVFAISSRFSFLESRTREWFKYYKVDSLFDLVYLNKKDEQPHEFKARMIRELRVDSFVDDDLPLIRYLRGNNPQTKIIFVGKNGSWARRI